MGIRSPDHPATSLPTSFYIYVRLVGYKSMLNSVFSLKGFNLAEDPVLKNLVKVFEVDVPRARGQDTKLEPGCGP